MTRPDVVANEDGDLIFLRVADDRAIEVEQSLADDACVGRSRVLLDLDTDVGHEREA